MSQVSHDNDTKKTTMTTPPRTKGEELYLVHLTRYEPSPDDFDIDTRQKPRSLSAGEELWDIHCRRSQGRALEEEVDEDNDDEKDAKTTPKKRRTIDSSVAAKPIKAIRSLRNREIAIA